MKRTLCLLLAASLAVMLCGCSSLDIPNASTATPITTTQSTTTTVPPATTQPTADTMTYPIGNLLFELATGTEVSFKSPVYSFPVVDGQSYMMVCAIDVSDVSVSSLDTTVLYALKSFTDEYKKIGVVDASMDIAGFSAIGETFSVMDNENLYSYIFNAFTDTYYVYVFIYMTSYGVSDSAACALAYGNMISNLEYVGRAPRT